MTAKPDPLIHPITRLSICGLLAAGADWVEFAAQRDAAGISDSGDKTPAWTTSRGKSQRWP